MPTKAQPAGAGLTAAQLAAFRDARKKHLLATGAKGGRLTREEKVEVAEFMPGAAPAPKGKPTKRRPAPRAKAEEAPAPAAPEPASIAPRPVAPPPPPRDWAAVLETYVSDVLAGNIPAGKWLKLACQRHRRDMERAGDPAWPFVFDPIRAARVCRGRAGERGR